MLALNLDRCPFLKAAYEYIKDHPGASKAEVVLHADDGKYDRRRMPNDTYSYRNAALNRLIEAGLVVDDRFKGPGYRLVDWDLYSRREAAVREALEKAVEERVTAWNGEDIRPGDRVEVEYDGGYVVGRVADVKCLSSYYLPALLYGEGERDKTYREFRYVGKTEDGRRLIYQAE